MLTDSSEPPSKSQGAASDGDEVLFRGGIQHREAGNLEESRRLLQAVVDSRTKSGGLGGFPTQLAMSQLGRTLRLLGRIAQARHMHSVVLCVRLELYGAGHAYTQRSAGILCDTLRMTQDQSLETVAGDLERWCAGSVPTQPEVTVHKSYDGDRNLLDALMSTLSSSEPLRWSYYTAPVQPQVMRAMRAHLTWLSISEPVKCWCCNGTGAEWRSALHGGGYRTCKACGGTGEPVPKGNATGHETDEGPER